jgi:hypothetical protein
MNRSHCASLALLPLLFVAAPAFAQTAPPPAPPPTPADATPAPAAPPAPAASGGYDAVPPPPPAPAASSGTLINLTTLRILKDKGIITQAEYDSAVRDMGDSVGQKGAGEQNTVVVGKWATTLYGFVEADNIFDTTQSFQESAGNGQVQRGGTYAGSNNRLTFGVRNSRIGFRLKAPEVGGIRSSAVIEADFLGNQLPIGPSNSIASTGISTAPGATGNGTSTEQQYFTNPTFRLRHGYLKVETPVVDFLFGQYWDLYGWQQTYAPNSVEIQGLPGQLYSRTPQVRISKTVKNDAFLFEAAIAVLRSPQRDSAVPKGQWGVRLGTPAWSGLTTGGATGTGIQPLSVAVTGDIRSFTLPYPGATGNASEAAVKFGDSIAVDAFVPIIPAQKRKGNALSAQGEFSTGFGNADLYTGLTGGASSAYPTNLAKPAAGASPASPDIDPGFAVYDNLGNIHLVEWTSYRFGLEYYFPGCDGKFWISGNYSYIGSNNLKNLALNSSVMKPSGVRDNETFYDANLFWDATDAVRLGLEGAVFTDKYADGAQPQNFRVQFSAFYIF